MVENAFITDKSEFQTRLADNRIDFHNDDLGVYRAPYFYRSWNPRFADFSCER